VEAALAKENTVDLLKEKLGSTIKLIAKNEIRYCPDNTCEIYKAKKQLNYLADYVFLQLFYKSNYVYLDEKSFGVKAFRVIAKKEETIVFNKVIHFCQLKTKTIDCVLAGMVVYLEISNCFGRFDEGYFCYGCNKNENICQKR